MNNLKITIILQKELIMTSKTISSNVFIILFFFILSGCSSMKPLDEGLSSAEIVGKINPGDEIIIHTTDNEKHLIVVESITEEKIVGSGKSFEYQNITEIKKEGVDVLKTTGAVIGGAYLYAGIMYLFLLAAL